MIKEQEIYIAKEDELKYAIKQFFNSKKHSDKGLNNFKPAITYGYVVNQQSCLLYIKLTYKELSKELKESTPFYIGFTCEIDASLTKLTFPSYLSEKDVKKLTKQLDMNEIFGVMKFAFKDYGFKDSLTHK